MEIFKDLFKKGDNGEVYSFLLNCFKGTAFITGLDSAAVLSIPLFMIFMKGLESPYVAGALTAIIIGIYLYCVEGGIFIILVPTLTSIIAGDWKILPQKKQRAFKGLLWISGALCVFLIIVTVGVTLFLRDSAAESVTERPIITDVSALQSNADNAQLKKIAAIDAEIAKIQKDRDDELGGVKKKSAALAPFGMGGTWVERQNALKSKERQYESEYKSKKNNIMSKYDIKLDAQRQAKINVLNDPTAGASIAAVGKANDFNMDLFKKHAAAWATLFMWLSVGATALMFIVGLLLSLYQASFNVGKFERLIDNLKQDVFSAITPTGATSTPLSVGTLSGSFLNFSTERIAVHEAGHLCAFGYMKALGQNANIEISKISIEVNGELNSLGHVVQSNNFDNTAINLQMYLSALTAGYAAEYVALGAQKFSNPLDYLKAINMSESDSSDWGLFHKTLTDNNMKGVFEDYYAQSIQFFEQDPAMLMRITSDVITKKVIEGDDMVFLFGQVVNWYRQKAGKQPIAATAPTPSVKTEEKPTKRFSEYNMQGQVDVCSCSYDPREAYDYTDWVDACDSINPMVIYIKNSLSLVPLQPIKDLALEISKKRLNPTPSVKTGEKPETVPQPIDTVPQPKAEKTTSLLDDKLELLRGKILKYGESHFNNSQANDGTVAKNIFKLCDEAYMSLRQKIAVNKSVLDEFAKAATGRLDLCEKFKLPYDNREAFFFLIDKRGKEGSNE